jgi:hypothetical protein
VFNSLNESIKKRYNPDDFIPKKSSEKDIIHRGYIKNARYPIKYSFIPNNKTPNSGSHIYSFNTGGISGVVEINHRYSPSMNGHETKSHVQFEYTGNNEKFESIDLHRMILPIITHHVESHDPDIISFGKSIKNVDDIIRRIDSNMVVTKGENSTVAKKSIDPKTKRVLSHIRKKLNK